MPRGLRNWNFRQITKFLMKNGFRRNKRIRHGSHIKFTDNKGGRMVNVAFHPGKTSSPKILKKIIKRSGIESEEWLDRRKS